MTWGQSSPFAETRFASSSCHGNGGYPCRSEKNCLKSLGFKSVTLHLHGTHQAITLKAPTPDEHGALDFHFEPHHDMCLVTAQVLAAFRELRHGPCVSRSFERGNRLYAQ